MRRSVRALSFSCGFISLSAEILWVRLFGFANMSTPKAFGFVLSFYLVGIAAGAAAGRSVCKAGTSDERLWRHAAAALLLSGATVLLAPVVFATASLLDTRLFVAAACILATAFTVAYIFPIVHHLGAESKQQAQGGAFANVYFYNVMGAALGPLATGYVVLGLMTLQQAFCFVALLSIAAAVFFNPRGNSLRFSSAAAAVAMLLIFAISLEKHWLVQELNSNSQHAKTVIENRYGIITVFNDEKKGDAVFGGNVYDGRTNLSGEVNSNGLHRPMLLTALHAKPRRVLVLGLSVGTWLALINEFEGVELVDVVEINPGYIELAKAYPEQAKAMADPRVNLVINDARRWLRTSGAAKYDLIVMNTTFHWRSNSSLLLSSDFLRQVKTHMAPGAILTFNTTGSPDALYTATRVFNNAYRYSNFVYASDHDFRAKKEDFASRQRFSSLKVSGSPVFMTGSAKAAELLDEPFVTVEAEAIKAGRPLEEITDSNMLVEFKFGRNLN